MISDVTEEKEPAKAPANPLVELRGIDVRFGGVHAIDDVSMSMGADEIVGLIGPNGAGKSTLVGVIAGTVRPGGGSVRLLGREVSGRPARKRSALGLARTFQHPAVFATLTVRENLEFGRALRRSAGRQLSAEQVAFCEDVIDRLDVTRWLDWRAGAVPHPVQRMVETARAVLTAAPLMLVDEPAAGLNESARGSLVHVLQDYRSQLGAGILLVEHDVPLVLATCTRIVVLHEGRLLADATPEEIRNDPQVIDAYFGAPL